MPKVTAIKSWEVTKCEQFWINRFGVMAKKVGGGGGQFDFLRIKDFFLFGYYFPFYYASQH